MNNEIAIIGIACRFPGAQNYEEFWDNLKEGRSSIQEIPKERWDWKEYWGDPQADNKSNSKWGGFIQDADAFDPGFFGLSAREVEATDPQQRIMLELSWSCLEDAGILPSEISGDKIGVYMGVFNFDYKGLQEQTNQIIETYHSIGTASAVIANRISHFFNFKGPSFPIDTACSSSFNAIHSAAQSILLGESNMALAGGISLILTPSRHISFSKAGMLSPTGSCKTFDDSADGYVRSEGAGVVLLKPLEQALEDGNSIYGVLKGTAVNHNGRTHTLTYPNPEAQADVIAEAHKKADIPVESISYIEAHGTGTPKGDPMEFQGLLKAFQLRSNQDQILSKNYCGLGSVKTNIGHLESAAGIAGLIKVLMSMKHKQLPGLQNFKTLNHRISIKGSPFYMVDKLQEWKLLEGADGQSFPRRAGISSFGFGGTNSHIILEEAPAVKKKTAKKLPHYLICLSAKTEESLRQRELDLARWIDRNGSGISLTDVSATLLLQREHFGIRSAYVVKDVQELREKLKQVLENSKPDGYCKDQIPLIGKKQEPLLEHLGKVLVTELLSLKRSDVQEYRSKLKALAELYVKGHEVDWKDLFPKGKIQHVHLPTYPFARERYWIPVEGASDHAATAAVARTESSYVHPLLHQNTSDFSEQRYSSIFTGEEFFLKDHIVKGRHVLPGVAYLEMAREAVEKASGLSTRANSPIRLRHVVWAKPVIVGKHPVQVHITLFPGENGDVTYEVYSQTEKGRGESIIHSQGNARINIDLDGETTSVSIDRLKGQLTRANDTVKDFYETFHRSGIHYGPAHRGMEEVYNGGGRVLVKLLLPSLIESTAARYILHPSLLDSALQAAMILMLGSEKQGTSDGKGSSRLFLPFALEQLDVLQRCASVMWAHVQYSDQDATGGQSKKVDIDLYDEQGTLCVRMRELSWREQSEEESLFQSRTDSDTLMMHPIWKEQVISRDMTYTNDQDYCIVLCEMDDAMKKRMETDVEGARILSFQSNRNGMKERFQDYSVKLLYELQSILKVGTRTKAFIQVVFSRQGHQQLMSGLAGLLKTARLENPNLGVQMIEVDSEETPEELVSKLKNNLHTRDFHIRYEAGKRLVKGWNAFEALQAEDSNPWKDTGTYLITGGMGGLGFIFANEIAKRTKGSTLILTGRSALSNEMVTQLEAIRIRGARVEYRRADVTNSKEADDLIQRVTTEFGGLNGIIHSAGVIKDSLILNKTVEDLQAVLAPKVKGIVNLDQASKDLKLDLFVVFSSVFGVVGNPGQADYCSANAFMDAYVTYRNELVRSKERSGHTLSMNWPLWKDGGMHVDEKTEQMMMQQLGMAAIDTGSAVLAFYQAWASRKDQVLVMAGDLEHFYTQLTEKQTVEPKQIEPIQAVGHEDNESLPDMSEDDFTERAIRFVKKQISTVLKLPVQRIETDAPMEHYGIDSIMTTQLTNELEKTFGSLSKTLFFEYQNIRELTGYFIKSYRDKLVSVLGEGLSAEPLIQHAAPYVPTKWPDVPHPASLRRSRFVQPTIKQQDEHATKAMDIAIIGMSGRYPGAENVRQFWEVLKNGKDCITEIPNDRWDYNLYYDEDRNKPGTANSKWGGFITGVDRFDPLFFNISPREAEMMDPQERLFLQCVYETLEDAGYTREALGLYSDYGLEGSVGVYVGAMYQEYQLYGAQEQAKGNPLALPGLPASIANRVSYFFNFHGPSMTIDTMCSSSLTAIHLASQSLLSGECKVSIAGGVNVSIHPNKYLYLSQGKFISGRGRCESFGEGGEGYVPGEGVGAVLLKPLSKAIADRDQIYGIIKATAINHGGKTNGYTVPNPKAQSSVIGRAFKKAGIEPRTISYMEAHGTGTSLGDPIEITGLHNIFQEYTGDKQFCALGSAKSNIGHCESAAGIAGLTKVLLQLKYKQLVPSLHSRVLNPNIDFSQTPFVVQQELAEWKRPVLDLNGVRKEYPRIAGISSFGAGGSNAHIVIEEYIPGDEEPSPIIVGGLNPVIIVLSGKSEEQLRLQAQRLLADLSDQPHEEYRLIDMAYTLQVGREAMEERLAVIVSTMKELTDKLKEYIEGRDHAEGIYYGQVKRNKEALSVFTRDEELQEAIAKWIQRRKYDKLASLWVKGLDVEWNRLYGDTKPRRISLPTYPFSEDRYWVPEPSNVQTLSNPESKRELVVPNRQISPVERKVSYLNKRWELAAVYDSVDRNKSATQTIAILTTQETMELAIHVSRYFEKCRIIDIQDMVREFHQTEQDWKQYGGCIDVVGCGLNTTGLTGWIPWLQKWIEHADADGLTLLGVTKCLESFRNAEVNLSGAERAGLYRMLQSEYSRLNSRHVDVDAEPDVHFIAEQIVNEYAAESRDTEICYRSGKRYRATLEELQEIHPGQETFAFPDGHVLWITGGTRGIGYLCARHFVQKYGVKKLVLTGREVLPSREEWSLFKGQKTPVAQKIQAIQALEELQADVKILSVSLSDEQAVRQSMESVKRTMGPIGGVIHCAGRIDTHNPAFIRKSVEGIEQVFEPKVSGLRVLYECFRNESLSFFLLFSSVSSTIPALASGQSDYGMANAYMDYFAEKAKHTVPITSIQWPSWKEAGMGEVRSRAYEQTGLLSITNEEGLQLLDQILSNRIQSVVLPAVVNPELWDPGMLMQIAEKGSLQGRMRQSGQKPESNSNRSPSLLNQTQAWLTELLAEELKIPVSKLEPDTAFQDYGVDSIMIAQLLRRINQLAGLDLEPTLLFEYPTIESLAGWMVNAHSTAVSQMLETMDMGEFISDVKPSSSQAPMASLESGASRKELQGKPATGIAVVGLSCRFPGAGSLEDYWRILSEGISAIRQVPYERWGHSTSYYAGMLEEISSFDPSFFLIPQEDARVMDPQALLVLEESLKLICHAGYSWQELKGKPMGVYIGARTQHQPEESYLYQARNPIVAIGQNYLSANISHFLDLRGPSVVVDTACSSALVAMNMAVQALRAGDIDSAIVGGASLLTTDRAHKIFEQRGILSPVQDFHMFDKRAEGIVLGEGAGMVLLKTVEQAIADGDRIYAVIKGLAVNNDGRTAGPSTPNIQAQRDVLQTALRKSGRHPEEISYIETNGSGTTVTDLLELKAIQSIYRESSTVPLGLGSMKPNIGHPLCAEGIASFIKVVLMLHNGQFVPFLSGGEAMVHYDMESSPFYFSREKAEWAHTSRVAAINCFADGGTNAHVILEDGAGVPLQRVRRLPLSVPELNRRQLWETQSHSKTLSSGRKTAANVPQGIFWENFD
ncbi:SDR family NAD(P)-dependent oxidoreductase [Paenibacillus lautus]|uniref:SDR family NAD(P)-dependent oxidoreductase n=1 Tax=Paenibacillus lautus TaxID=1401 RepID=UPI003D2E6B8B